ncbi:MAG: hypothetical protein HY266_01675 [Deltaproteobacteria bacterium]|nr:hypothetical protein [Deltaproteobacteria bacterium]
MIGILVMLNNYFHDFATALVVVCTYGMLLMVRYAEKNGGEDSKRMVLALYPKMMHLTGGSVVFVFMAGIVRTFTYKEFEWHDAVATGQVPALIIKHIILFILFAYGIYLWAAVHKKVKDIKKGMTENLH